MLEKTTTRSASLLAFLLLQLMLLLLAAPALAAPLAAKDVPPALEDWVGWVLDQEPERDCVTVQDQKVCEWPGSLSLEVRQTGAHFSAKVRTDRAGPLRLPGSVEAWPEDVLVDGKPSVVFAWQGAPAVELTAGRHTLSGRFVWQSAPEGLPVPEQVGRVFLSIDGESVPFPKRDPGRVWLRSTESPSGQPESLSLEVFRRVQDAVPMLVTTQILVRAAGRAREHDFGNVLVPGTSALSLNSELPVRLQADGSLRAQLRAGTHRIELVARVEGDQKTLKTGKRGDPWPETEVWVFQAAPELREVTVSGAPSVDPGRTNLEPEWRSLPAYLLDDETTLALETTRRGEASPPPNQLYLNRNLWLDLDGEGFTVSDTFTGKVQQGWRLDLLEGVLGRASVDQVDQFITLGPGGKRTGVELRNSGLNLVGEARLPRTADLRAVGWSDDVHSLSATLKLPPGWRLFAASGVDRASDTWWSSWDLFGFFFVLIVALAVARLSSPLFGGLTLLALVVSHGEDGAPRYVFVALLLSWALLRVIPAGKLRTLLHLFWFGSALTLGVLFLGFCVDQVRTALYPQLAQVGHTSVARDAMKVAAPMQALEEMTPDEPPPPMDAALLKDDERTEPEAGAVGKSRAAYGRGGGMLSKLAIKGESLERQSQLRQDPKSVIQTGPGIPTWNWRAWKLTWSGPVDKTQRMRLYLISPRIEAALSMLRILLLGLVGWHFIRRAPLGQAPPPRPSSKPKSKPVNRPRNKAASVAAVVFGASCLIWTAPARAQLPSPELLKELQSRLLRPPACADDCVSVSNVELSVTDGQLRLKIDAHAAAPAALKLPGPAQSWVFAGLEVDGQANHDVAWHPDGFLHLRLDLGRHSVVMTGPIEGDELTLSFEEEPRRISVDADGWEVDGVRADGRISGSVRLLRKLEEGVSKAPTASRLPPWFSVERAFEIGVTWSVATTVTRVSPTGSPVVIRYRLLPGESVTEAESQVDGGELVLSFGRDDQQKSFSSSLETTKKLRLSAAKGRPYTQIWTLGCGVVWRCTPAGIPPSKQQQENVWRPLYRPWPGEVLELSFARPQGSEGNSTTIDQADLHYEPGARLTDASLDLRLRSSSGGQQTLLLPKGAKLTSLLVNGTERAAALKDNRLNVSLDANVQRLRVAWREARGIAPRFQTGAVDLGRSATNVNVRVDLPENRWLLFAGGPSWGPAILFWGYLIVLLLGAWVLARLPKSPLQAYQWALLGVGLTQIPSLAVVWICGWFFALAYRRQLQVRSALRHNLLQLFLAGATLVTLLLLGRAVWEGLVMQPDMQVSGAGSTGEALKWYLDRAGPALPEVSVVSLPLWVWRVLMLLWALWLTVNLVGWLRWAWAAYSEGSLWRQDAKWLPSFRHRPTGGRARTEADPPTPPASEKAKPPEGNQPPPKPT